MKVLVAVSIAFALSQPAFGQASAPPGRKGETAEAEREILHRSVAGSSAAWRGDGSLGGAAHAPIGHALALGIALTLAGIANNLMVPPPLWFWVASLAVLIPASCVGARLVPERSRVTAASARV